MCKTSRQSELKLRMFRKSSFAYIKPGRFLESCLRNVTLNSFRNWCLQVAMMFVHYSIPPRNIFLPLPRFAFLVSRARIEQRAKEAKGCLWVCTRPDIKASMLHERLHSRENSRSNAENLSTCLHDRDFPKNLSFHFVMRRAYGQPRTHFYWISDEMCVSVLNEAVSGCAVCVWYDCLHMHINIPLLSLSKINKSFRLQHHPRRGETELRTLSIIFIYSRDEAKHCEWKGRSRDMEISFALICQMICFYICAPYKRIHPENRPLERFCLSALRFSEEVFFSLGFTRVYPSAKLNIRKRITF